MTGGSPSRSVIMLNWAPQVLASQCDIDPENCLNQLYELRLVDNVGWLRAVGDFNGDGRIDIIVEAPGATEFIEPKAYIYRQEAGGQFTKIALANRLRYDPVGDFNRDGSDDLILSQRSACGVVSFSSDLQATAFTPTAAYSACTYEKLQVLDFNGDGKTDLVPLGRPLFQIFLGTEENTFAELRIQAPYGFGGSISAADDMDGDGTGDLLIADGGYREISLSIAYGAGSGNFSNLKNSVYSNLTGATAYPSGPTIVADFNRDGFKDVLQCPGSSLHCQMVLGNGHQSLGSNAKLVLAENTANFGLVVADVNDDGVLDIVYRGQDGEVLVRRGDGAGNFSVAAKIRGSEGGWDSPRVGDINGDGKSDLIATGAGGSLLVFVQR